MMGGPVPRGLDEARAELNAITARAVELRVYIESETERRRRAAHALVRYEPCDWCGSRRHTVPEMRQWVLTGRYICRWPGPCRLAWMIGEDPETFRAQNNIDDL